MFSPAPATAPLLLAAAAAAAGGGSPGEGPQLRIAGAALAGGGALATARSLADGVGARPSGSPAAERATVWAEQTLRRVGLEKVRREQVQVATWLRGEESAAVVAPVAQPLAVLALGGSVATPGDGLVAEVVEVPAVDAVAALGARASGKIVFINRPMERTRDGSGYSAAVAGRGRGASEAAKVGAVAALVRSAGTGFHRLPHTGSLRYEEGVPRLPAAALAAEDAELLHRLLAAGAPVKVRLRLTAKAGPAAPAWNVVGELRGRARPEEIVVIGGHLDSWDVGTGALDDASGCAIAIDTVRVFGALGLRPRRTVRVVLWAGEEFGVAGAKGYAEAHKAELQRHVAAMEADAGAGRPLGYRVAGGEGAVAMVERWVKPLAHLVPAEVRAATSVATDVHPLIERGVPGLAVAQDMSDYFEWHHTQGDTADKIDPAQLALATAAFASLTWMLADAPERLPGLPAATAAKKN
jgi:carboxypeptidase Q